jgi:hypothetical protein
MQPGRGLSKVEMKLICFARQKGRKAAKQKGTASGERSAKRTVFSEYKLTESELNDFSFVRLHRHFAALNTNWE